MGYLVLCLKLILNASFVFFTFLFTLKHLNSYLANKYATSKKIILKVKTKILVTIKNDLICYGRYNLKILTFMA